jgi:hypothetical protein
VGGGEEISEVVEYYLRDQGKNRVRDWNAEADNVRKELRTVS